MAMRPVVSRSGLARVMEGNWRSSASIPRYFSHGNGRVLGEEERATETVYQKMERERLDKLRKDEQERAQRLMERVTYVKLALDE